MRRHGFKMVSWMFVWICLSSIPVAAQMPAFPPVVKSKPAAEKAATTVLPAQGLDAAEIDRLVAPLSDEQVRRMLIEALKQRSPSPAPQVQRPPAPKAEGILLGFIRHVKILMARLKERVAILKSGTAAPVRDLPRLFQSTGGQPNRLKMLTSIGVVMAILLGGLGVQWLFGRYLAAMRRRIETTVTTGWIGQLGSLAVGLLLDLLAMTVLIVVALTAFYAVADQTPSQRLMLAVYLVAVIIVQAMYALLRFLLAPNAPVLRILPLSDEAAIYLSRWLTALTAVGSFGFLTCGLIRLSEISETTHLMLVGMVALVMALMLMFMILQKRKAVRRLIAQKAPPGSGRVRLAEHWHQLAILAVILLWVFSLMSGFIGAGQTAALKALFFVAFYLLADWSLCRLAAAAFGRVKPPTATNSAPVKGASALKNDQTPAVSTPVAQAVARQASPPTVDTIHRIQRIVIAALRVSLAALIFFWMLRSWGIDIKTGWTVAGGAFHILMVLLLGYVVWEVLSALIQRRMKTEIQTDENDETEEGGAGGSRMVTLLMLLRKFLLAVIVVMGALIILARMGVNIGPLIAGAGVVGLAIGFGAQTLVKDIISGVFFLIDDAFRVGDYIEAAGTKGMVQQISLRSLKLRHPRGMVNTIPFGDIGTVTNYSRDYIITKLDFRLRYDSDLETVRKLIKKKVSQPILADETLAGKLLGDIKSQGVREMDDSAMIMRIKFKTIPGEQFAIRKEVYQRVQEAFKTEGIEFAYRNVTVYLPPGDVNEVADAAGLAAQRQNIGAAAAAALNEADKNKA